MSQQPLIYLAKEINQTRDISPRERRRSAGLRYQLASKGFRTLTGLIGEAGLLGTLSSDDEFTVFAPSDTALGDFLANNPAVAESLEVKLKTDQEAKIQGEWWFRISVGLIKASAHWQAVSGMKKSQVNPT